MTLNLTLGRTHNDLPRPEENDRFWMVECDGVGVGVIVTNQGRTDNPPDWHWVVHLHAGRFSNGVPTPDGIDEEQAMVAFRAAFERSREHIRA